MMYHKLNGLRLAKGSFVCAACLATWSVALGQLPPSRAVAVETLSPAVSLVSDGFESWQFFSGKKDAKLSETWSMAIDAESGLPMIVCTGEPHGYLRTTNSYRDFELYLEWRFPKDANGNSGVLLFTSDEAHLWPTSLQVQLHQQEAGRVFPSGGARVANEIRQVPMLSRPLNHWNSCFIRSQNGKVSITINDQPVGEVTGCEPSEGGISLQSEGAEIHFRKIWIRELPPQPPNEASTSALGLPKRSGLSGRAANGNRQLARCIKRKTPLVTRPKGSQVARGEKRLNAEWVRLQTWTCDF